MVCNVWDEIFFLKTSSEQIFINPGNPPGFFYLCG
ncbi:hypothetical protein FIC_02364 [Flavobacteriaceae bacterium 3519-10]|nr:hypothetical protein FIC_02364 [Flavobacteriaceae bacterium 3519-10]